MAFNSSALTDHQVREDVVLFAATYPTPNTRRAVELCQSGRLTWRQVYDLFQRSLAEGLQQLARADAQGQL